MKNREIREFPVKILCLVFDKNHGLLNVVISAATGCINNITTHTLLLLFQECTADDGKLYSMIGTTKMNQYTSVENGVAYKKNV